MNKKEEREKETKETGQLLIVVFGLLFGTLGMIAIIAVGVMSSLK